MSRGGHHNHTFKKAKNFKKTLYRVIAFIGKHKGLMLLIVIFTILSVIIESIAPAYLGNSITYHLEDELNLTLFAKRMLVLVVMYVCAYLFSNIAGIALTFLGGKILLKMRRAAFYKVQKLSISYFDKIGIGDIISRLTNDIETIQNFIYNGFSQLVRAVFSLIFVITAMFMLNVKLTLAILITFPLIAIIVMIIGKRIRKAAKENQKQIGALNTKIEESVTGMKIIQSFHREEQEYENFKKVNRNARDAAIKMEAIAFVMFPVMNFINYIALVIIIGIGGILAINNPNIYSIGLLTSFLIYARKFFEPLRQIAQVYNSMQSAFAGAERVFEILDSKEEINIDDKATMINQLKGKVCFENVSFAYNEDKEVLRNISLCVESGESIAIVGPTGAGKTTIINLLMRFYDINKGCIYIDDIPLKEIDLNEYRQKLGVVLQEPFFFATTIRENLLYGKLNASEKELIYASKTANAYHFITRLPDGFDTVLTERGLNISQGERQLLAIARTVLANPSILILDEATSNIDSLTELHIQDAMINLMKNRTSFIIAHRLSTIKNANRIIVIDNHTIVEKGNHAELIAKKGHYYNLYHSQYVNNKVLN